MSLKNDVLFSLEVHGDIEFRYQGKDYFIGWNKQKNGYAIYESPGTLLAEGRSIYWEEALDEPIFKGKSMNDLFDKIEFISLT